MGRTSELVVAVVCLAACAASVPDHTVFRIGPANPPGKLGATESRIQGQIVVDPACVFFHPPCTQPMRQLPARLSFAQGGQVVATGVNPRPAPLQGFAVDLPPGTYRLTITPLGAGSVTCPAPRNVVAPPGQAMALDVHCVGP